jgi:hypothetical protein
MRLWSLHPRYLDRPGLLALWRESLLAQAVLRGKTVGYRRHPQLIRFRSARDPLASMAFYLRVIFDESLQRGFRFDRSKFLSGLPPVEIAVTNGQLNFEWTLLKQKLSVRNPAWLAEIETINVPAPHPLFRIIPGGIETWEVVRQDI